MAIQSEDAAKAWAEALREAEEDMQAERSIYWDWATGKKKKALKKHAKYMKRWHKRQEEGK